MAGRKHRHPGETSEKRWREPHHVADSALSLVRSRGDSASPTVSADLSRTAYSHDHRIQLVKGRHSHRDLGQQLVVGVLYDSPRSLAFSPDGQQLASGHQYGSVRLWDVDAILEGKRIGT